MSVFQIAFHALAKPRVNFAAGMGLAGGILCPVVVCIVK